MNKLKLEIQILLMKYRHLMTPELEQKFDELHDEIESDEEWKCLDIQNITKSWPRSASSWKENKRTSERASKQAGWVGPRAASRGASKQAIKRPMRKRASNVEYDPNRWLRGKVFRGGLQADRGVSYF